MCSATTLGPAHEPSAGVAVTALAQKGPLGSSPSPFKNPCRRGDPSPVIKLGGPTSRQDHSTLAPRLTGE